MISSKTDMHSDVFMYVNYRKKCTLRENAERRRIICRYSSVLLQKTISTRQSLSQAYHELNSIEKSS